jgi:hypothetical protein
MNELEAVRKALIAFLAKYVKPSHIVGKVVDVNESEFTCTVKPITGGAEYHGVKLKPTNDADDNGAIAIPEVNSIVLISYINNDAHNYQLTAFSKISKYTFKCTGDILFNDGTNHGLVKVQELTQRLNDLQTAHNKLLNDFMLHLHTDPLSGTTGTIVTPPTSTSLVPTQQSEIENSKIKH